MSFLQALILAIIEGLTEFLPVSSTGHMVIASSFMGIASDDFTKLYEIVTQLAAILAVVVVYFKKFFDFKNYTFYIRLLIALIPSLLIGALLKKHIDAMLENPLAIAVVLLLGGIILLFVDKWFTKNTLEDSANLDNKNVFQIGLFQTLAILFPGLSRSAATIIGGMQQGLTRRAAAEFSFFLAVPTMLAATVKSIYDIYKEKPEVLTNITNLNTLIIGCLIAFFVAYISIRFLINYLSKYGFKFFGIYRIVLALIIFGLYFGGVPLFINK
jgi:undecaprenyl-diphosphatase